MTKSITGSEWTKNMTTIKHTNYITVYSFAIYYNYKVYIGSCHVHWFMVNIASFWAEMGYDNNATCHIKMYNKGPSSKLSFLNLPKQYEISAAKLYPI